MRKHYVRYWTRGERVKRQIRFEETDLALILTYQLCDPMVAEPLLEFAAQLLEPAILHAKSPLLLTQVRSYESF